MQGAHGPISTQPAVKPSSARCYGKGLAGLPRHGNRYDDSKPSGPHFVAGPESPDSGSSVPLRSPVWRVVPEPQPRGLWEATLRLHRSENCAWERGLLFPVFPEIAGRCVQVRIKLEASVVLVHRGSHAPVPSQSERLGLCPSRECPAARDLPAHYQGIDEIGALVGVDGFHVRPVARHVMLIEDTVAAYQVAGIEADLSGLA